MEKDDKTPEELAAEQEAERIAAHRKARRDHLQRLRVSQVLHQVAGNHPAGIATLAALPQALAPSSSTAPQVSAPRVRLSKKERRDVRRKGKTS